MATNLPANAGAERYILTTCLRNPDSIVDMANKLAPEDFFYDSYRYSYQICLNLVENNMVPEPMTIFNRLEAMGVGKPQDLKELELLKKASYDIANLPDYITAIRDCSARRQLIEAQETTSKDLRTNPLSAEAAVALSEERILEISNKISNVLDVYKIGSETMGVILERGENPVVVPGIPTGFNSLDKDLQGLQPGRLYVLAARLKTGKSIWLMNVVKHVAVDLGIPVLMIDTENPSRQVDDRFLSLTTGIEEAKIKNGMFKHEADAPSKISSAIDQLENAQIYHHYMPNFTFEAALSLIKKYKMQKGIGLVVFDYIKAPDNTDFSSLQEYQLLGYLTSGLKNKVAGAMNIPVITACQLGRKAIGAAEASDDHVADSDRIMRYADAVLYFRSKTDEEIATYGGGPTRGNMVLSILANRGGQAQENAYDIWFDKPVMKMVEKRCRKL